MRKLRFMQREINLLVIFGPALLLTVLGFLAAYQFVEPAPPRDLVISAGRSDGAYYAYAQEYAKVLAEFGIRVEVRESAGSIENLQRLAADGTDVGLAFVQSGTAGAVPTTGLESLASIYYEPLWVFSRAGVKLTQLADLAGRRVAVGRPGSGTRLVAEQVLTANGIDSGWVELAGADAAQALLTGEVDAAFFVASPNSPVVADLLHDARASLFSAPRTAAYTRRFPFLAPLLLPEGGIDLRRNLPARDVQLLSPAATLAVRESIHPALVDLIMQATARIHRGGGVFERPNEFPSSEFLELPQNQRAALFLRNGPPLLQRYLPFWAANLIDRLKVMLVPLVALLLPMLRILPPLYRWRSRSHIHKLYKRLRRLETEARGLPPEQVLSVMDRTLNELDDEIAELSVPTAVIEDLYHLRLHIEFLRRDLTASAREAQPSS